MKLSVALGTHNGSRYIGEQVDSILTQTLVPNEIVLSDDASGDDTVAVVRRLLRDRPEVTLTIIENRPALGVVKNFEQAALAASGDLIALCDQDDSWHPTKLERIARVFEDRPDVALVHTDARLVDGDGVPLGTSLLQSLEVRGSELREIHDGQGFETLLRRNLVTGATTVVRAELVRAAAPFPSEWVHDEWLAIIAGAMGATEVLEDELIDYRQHGANQIGARKLTLSEKFAKFREPRADRNARILRRVTVLNERLDTLDIRPERVEKARAKLDFEHYRSSLPAAHARRALPIARRAFAGDYARFTLGLPDVVRDLLQPAR